MNIQNNIPFVAMLYEAFAALMISIIAILSYRKYRLKRTDATKYLSLTLGTLALSIVATSAGKIMMYYAPFTPEEMNITGFSVLIGYLLSATSNIFAAKFIQVIFKEENSDFAFRAAVANGITIGFILAKLFNPNVAFKTNAYNQILPVLIWHILVTAVIFSTLIVVSRHESKIADTKLASVGFKLISYYGIAYLMVFVFFVIDLVYGTAEGKGGYTVFYYLGWTSGILSTVLAYLGYLMPTWFRRKLEG